MRKTINQVGRWTAFGLAGLIVQDWFHGLELGRWIILVLVLLALTCITFVVTWPPLVRRNPYRLTRVASQPKTALGPGRYLTALTPPAPRESFTARELHDSAVRRRADVNRANVQLVSDELAWAIRIINEAIEDEGGYWTREIAWTTWDNVKSSLAGVKGFHAAYAATREAWNSLQRAEQDRLNHDASQSDVRAWEQRHIIVALNEAEEAQRLLFDFLAHYDA